MSQIYSSFVDLVGGDTKDDPVKNYKHLENDKSNKFTKFPSFLQIAFKGRALDRWAVISKTQMKNTKKLFHRGQQKTDAKDMKEAEDAERREKNLEDAKKIVIENNPSLPDPQTAKIYQLEDLRGKRVKVFGWVHRLRRQGKNLLFIVLRDGTGFLQCLFTDNPCQCYNGLVLSTESAVALYGTIRPAYLTQSSQLDLETCIPAHGLCSFSFEDLVCAVVDRVLKSPITPLLYDLNPNFKPLTRPFKRMNYTEAIDWLKGHDIREDDGTHYEFGEDIPEASERLMMDTINETILLCRFPAEISPTPYY
ncbi:hypothetical protein P4O66_004126 [Electrophorus voltai]|uniref:OB domain-containing protein n=1 Tax=Electrophorus voltai TaxID=2609070 RepID=A0AAD8ZQC8_9TELE|nr:hypothetical protein P4O66_004126 [Electrophorus voltai]